MHYLAGVDMGFSSGAESASTTSAQFLENFENVI